MNETAATKPLMKSKGIVILFEVAPEAKLGALKDTCEYEPPTKANPKRMVKRMADGVEIHVERVDPTHVAVSYKGASDDIGHARFAVDNIFNDLARAGLVAPADPTFSGK